MLIKELIVISEAHADVAKSITYLKSLGLNVDPTPVKNVDNEITFKIVGMSASEAFEQLDSVSFLDDDGDNKTDPNPNGRIWTGQGLENDSGYWYDRKSRNLDKEIYLDGSGKDPLITLSNYTSEESTGLDEGTFVGKENRLIGLTEAFKSTTDISIGNELKRALKTIGVKIKELEGEANNYYGKIFITLTNDDIIKFEYSYDRFGSSVTMAINGGKDIELDTGSEESFKHLADEYRKYLKSGQ